MFTSNLVKVLHKRKKRIGRGVGSGKGMHTVGRGQKGHSARAGFTKRIGFEGGRTPVHILFPKIGRSHAARPKPKAISLDVFLEKEVYDITLEEMKRVTKSDKFILVGPKSYQEAPLAKLKISRSIPISNSLREKVERAGGQFV